MLKTSKKMKGIIAFFLLMLIILNAVQSVLAASGTGQFVGGQYDSKMKTTDNQNTDKGVMIRRLINYSTGEKMTTFCAEYSVNFKTGVIYNGEYYTPTDSTIKKACKIAYLGWYSKYPDYVIDGGILAADMKWVKQEYVFTQQFIWETLGQSNATFLDETVQNDYIAFKNDINNKINNIEKKPSFCNIPINIDIGQTITLKDENKVLADYASIDKTIEGIRIIHNKGENTLTVTISDECVLESYTISEEIMKNWGMIKEDTKDNDTTIFFSFEDGVQSQFYAMNYNDPVTMSLNLHINLLGNIELTKLDEKGELIDGAVFEINGPENFSKEVTVTNGKIVLDKLKRGTYYIKEKQAPNGYLLNINTYKVEVEPNKTATQAIINKMPTGTFTLVKKNADKTSTIQGTKYRIWNNNGYSKEFTTDKEGKIVVTGLELGKYNYQETQATQGYLIDTNIYSFELNYKDQNTSVIYANTEKTNTEPTGTIKIIKKDSETGSNPQGDAKLENAIYKVYANEDIYNASKTKKVYSKGDLVATRTTNAIGETEDVTGLPLGKYLVKEEKAPIGYMIDKTVYEINLKYKDQNTNIITQSVTSIDKVKQMKVHIYKSGIKENSGLVPGLPDAEFTIKLCADIEKAYEKGYTYSEIWNGIDELGNLVEVDPNRVKEAEEIASTYEILITDENGNAYTKNKLPYGKYIIKETKAPKDFKNAKDITISITQDESEIQEIEQKVKHLTINNELLETYIKLIKKDSKTGKIVTLNSSTFEITVTQDIYDRGTGKIIYKKGDKIKQKIGNTECDSFTTNADNIVVPENSYNTQNDDKGSVTTPLLLPVGSYEITEIKVPQGFLELEQPISFNIESIKEYDKNDNGDYIKEIIIENEQPTGTLIINKNIVVREDVNTSLININDLSGIQFKLTAKQDIIDSADGVVLYKKEQKINIYNLDKNGNLKIENLPIGTYELQEIKTLDGLVLDTTEYEVKFTVLNQVTKVYTETKRISNNTTIIEISKTDITGEKELIGATLTVLDENGNIIDSWISNEENHKIEGLTVGKTYILKEEIAPEGYEIAENVKFEVKNDMKIQKVEMKDKPILKTVRLIKCDSITNEIINTNFKFGIYEDAKCINLIKEIESDKQAGTVIFEDLTYGIYYIKEIQAPEGYLLSDKIVKVEINNKGIFADEELLKEDNSICEFIYYNTQIPKIQTGNERNYPLLLSSLLISLSGLIFLISKNKF